MRSLCFTQKFALLFLHLTLLGLASNPVRSADFSPEQLEFFESKIRPVLAQECYECHNSRDKAKSGLVLDFREGLLQGGDLGPAVVPGKPEESILMEALRHESDLTMPKAGVKLDPPIIADFETWITMGAPDPRDAPPTDEELAEDTAWEAILETRKNWWSFQPIAPPAAKKSIDEWLERGIQEAGLQASEPASPETIARRLYFALIGLPPTPEEMAAFSAAAKIDSDQALADLTDQLLASPHFGERWARHWMDWIRYAESHGSEGDPRIDNAHLYRDYLIRALNADVPYDQLLREHVAGDLLDNPRINAADGINESIIATAHWRMVFHGFAPTDALDEKVRFTDDQINVFTKAFQGLTVSCARCHNHKFDAISQADYYALFGIFGSTRPGRKMIDLPDALEKNKQELAALKPEIRQAVASDWIDSLTDLPQRLEQEKKRWADAKTPQSLLHIYWLANKHQKEPDAVATHWDRLRNSWAETKKRRSQWNKVETKRSWDLRKTEEASKWFRYGNALDGSAATAGDFTISGKEEEGAIGQILPAGVYTHLLSSKHGARFTTADFSLDGEYELLVQARGGGNSMVRYVVQNYPRKGTVFKVIDLGKTGRENWKWHRFDLSYWNGDDVHIELATALDAPLLTNGKKRSWFGLREAILVKKGAANIPDNNGLENQDILFDTAAENGVTTLAEVGAQFAKALHSSLQRWGQGKATDADALFLDESLFLGLLPNEPAQLPSTKDLIDKYHKLESEIQSPTRVHGLDEWVAADQALYDRGDHKKPLDDIPRRFLDAIDPTPYQSGQSGRLELVENLLREDNPFTRRVIVNRLWTHIFGNGLVATADNFGRMGEKPSHPELLDQLAQEFSEEKGWSIKKMVKHLVSTDAFGRSSYPSPLASEKDPKNRLLSHFSVKRLEAEAVRDSLLAVSGNLTRELYGAPASGASARRSVYVNVIRNQLDPFLSIYDAPTPFSTIGKRSETNVPAQSLTMLNDPFVTSAASKFASNTSGEDGERIETMWQRALGRLPDEKEKAAALKFVHLLRDEAKQIGAQHDSLNQTIAETQAKQRAILQPARAMLQSQQEETQNKESGKTIHLNPVASWDFTKGLEDQQGDADLELVGDAKIADGTLLLTGGFAKSKPFAQDFRAKTLEVRLQLSRLDQKGGGAISLQDLNGQQFDSIVFAERKNREWLSGSNFHKRTKDFEGPTEEEAQDQPVHLVIVYDPDGTILAYRNGSVYGQSYQSEVARFAKDQSQVVLGLRHGTKPGGGRMLHGQIFEARIYDRALTSDEISALSNGISHYITKKKILESLSNKERKQLQHLDDRIISLEKEKAALGTKSSDTDVWRNVAHSIFNLKEFIYIH